MMKRVVLNYDDLRTLADGIRVTGQRIGATIGSYDMIHIGHSRYLMQAHSVCDVLFVGVDSDEVVKSYKKDDNRPIVPEQERLEMLLHTGYPSYVTLVTDVDKDGGWCYGMLEAIKPDVFITSIGSYTDQQLADIRLRVADVLELDRQAETSTSEKVRRILAQPAIQTALQLRELADQLESGQISASVI